MCRRLTTRDFSRDTASLALAKCGTSAEAQSGNRVPAAAGDPCRWDDRLFWERSAANTEVPDSILEAEYFNH